MNKWCLVILLFISLSFTQAFSTDLRDQYSPKETMIIQILGAIEPIRYDQIEFKRTNVNVPLEYGVGKVGDRYYLWAIAPENENNYTLIISGNGNDYKKDFVVSGNLTDYYIKPGFISSNKNFDIRVYLNDDAGKSINVDYPDTGSVYLSSGENILYFPSPKQTEFRIVNIGKYSVPAYLVGNASVSVITNYSHVNTTEYIVLLPENIQSTILYGSKENIINFFIFNRGNSSVNGIYLDYNRKVFEISPDEKITIAANSSISYNISIRSELNSSSNYTIRAVYPNGSKTLNVNLEFTSKPEEVKTSLKCYELSGTICSADQICSSQTTPSSDGLCCIGFCKQSSSSANSSSWIGYLIAVFVIIVGIYIWIKYSRVKADKNVIAKKVSYFDKKFKED